MGFGQPVTQFSAQTMNILVDCDADLADGFLLCRNRTKGDRVLTGCDLKK